MNSILLQNSQCRIFLNLVFVWQRLVIHLFSTVNVGWWLLRGEEQCRYQPIRDQSGISWPIRRELHQQTLIIQWLSTGHGIRPMFSTHPCFLLDLSDVIRTLPLFAVLVTLWEWEDSWRRNVQQFFDNKIISDEFYWWQARCNPPENVTSQK